MKRVYFVRHGESVSNVNNVVQGLDDPLSLKGIEQARVIAERVKHLNASKLISSDAARAHETAKVIEEATGLAIEISPLFREVRRPSSLIGMMRMEETYQAFLKEERSRTGEDWHFEDEENYHDLLARGTEALGLLEAHEDEDIIVLTHGHFLRFILMMVVMGEDTAPGLWKSFADKFVVTNTAITAMVHTGAEWRVLTWNDHAHFAE